jgi:DMSO/TMAO reductase YedYZ molybdopterin-dependent catalytic subunit
VDGGAGAAAAAAAGDAFAGAPPPPPLLHVHTAAPLCAEPPPPLLAASFITPDALRFVRSHLPVPAAAVAAGDDHALRVSVRRPTGGASEAVYSVAELKKRFPRASVVAVLTCSGNRRGDMQAAGLPAVGLPWSVGAIANVAWEGVWLRDVLADAGLSSADAASWLRHVHFEGARATQRRRARTAPSLFNPLSAPLFLFQQAPTWTRWARRATPSACPPTRRWTRGKTCCSPLP